jgi:hypothetical protein
VGGLPVPASVRIYDLPDRGAASWLARHVHNDTTPAHTGTLDFLGLFIDFLGHRRNPDIVGVQP